MLLVLIRSRHLCSVVGDSMLPTLQDGDLIIYKPFIKDKDILFEGMLVVAEDPIKKTTLLIKRVSKINSSGIEIVGDNKLSSIDSRQFGEIHKEQIKGIVEKVIPKKE